MIFYIDEAKNSKITNAATMQFLNAETKAKHSVENEEVHGGG